MGVILRCADHAVGLLVLFLRWLRLFCWPTASLQPGRAPLLALGNEERYFSQLLLGWRLGLNQARVFWFILKVPSHVQKGKRRCATAPDIERCDFGYEVELIGAYAQDGSP